MAFADLYFQRVKTSDNFIITKPKSDLKIIVTIPVFNEPEVLKTIESLFCNKFYDFSVEIIVVINSTIKSSQDVINQNLISENELTIFKNEKEKDELKLYITNIINVSEKLSGPGYARKIAMDEALRRFNFLNEKNGIIVSLDADTLVQENYFQTIFEYFLQNPQITGANIHFEHPVNGNHFDENIYKAVIIYELYLRYYVQALKYAGFPYAYQTVGSAFAVKAETYAKHGGMVTNNSGEDFYFLQKIIQTGSFGEIDNTTVFPSPRITDRVIFGTGVAVEQIIKKYQFDYPTYSFESFEILKEFIEQIPNLYQKMEFNNLQIDNSLKMFLLQSGVESKIVECIKNSNTENSFTKRFFNWFNSLKVLKFLNYYNNEITTKKSIKTESQKLLKKYDIELKDNYLEMLELLRKMK